MQRLGRAALPLLSSSLAERARRAAEAPADLEDGEEQRVAADVDRLAGLLAKAR